MAVDGHRYAGLESAFRENMIGVYQRLFWALGNPADAEAATEKVCFQVLLGTDYPAPVDRVAEATATACAQAVADHWQNEYGLSATTWIEVAASTGGRAATGPRLDQLLEPLIPRSRRLLLECATRRRGVADLAEMFASPEMQIREDLLRGLLQLATGSAAAPDPADVFCVRAHRVLSYLQDLVAARRPRRFHANREEAFALTAAARLFGAVPGMDLPRRQFTVALEWLLMEAAG